MDRIEFARQLKRELKRQRIDKTLAKVKESSGASSGSADWGDIGGTLSAQTDLQTALNAKAASTHTHAISDVTSLQTALDAKATPTTVGAGAPASVVATNNAAHQEFASKSITVAVGDQIQIEGWGTLLNNSGAAITPRFQIQLGAFTVEVVSGATLANSATNRATCTLTGRFVVTSTSAAAGMLEIRLNTGAAANASASIAATTVRSSYNTSSSNLTGAQTVRLMGRSSTTTATQNFTIYAWRVFKTAAV